METLLKTLDTKLAPIDVVALLGASFLGHSFTSLVRNCLTVLLGDRLAFFPGLGSTVLPWHILTLLSLDIVTFFHWNRLASLARNSSTLLTRNIHTVILGHIATLLMGNINTVSVGNVLTLLSSDRLTLLLGDSLAGLSWHILAMLLGHRPTLLPCNLPGDLLTVRLGHIVAFLFCAWTTLLVRHLVAGWRRGWLANLTRHFFTTMTWSGVMTIAKLQSQTMRWGHQTIGTICGVSIAVLATRIALTFPSLWLSLSFMSVLVTNIGVRMSRVSTFLTDSLIHCSADGFRRWWTFFFVADMTFLRRNLVALWLSHLITLLLMDGVIHNMTLLLSHSAALVLIDSVANLLWHIDTLLILVRMTLLSDHCLTLGLSHHFTIFLINGLALLLQNSSTFFLSHCSAGLFIYCVTLSVRHTVTLSLIRRVTHWIIMGGAMLLGHRDTMLSVDGRANLSVNYAANIFTLRLVETSGILSVLSSNLDQLTLWIIRLDSITERNNIPFQLGCQ